MFGASRTAQAAGWGGRPSGVQFQRASTEYLSGTSLGNLPTNNRVWVFSAWFKFDSLPSVSGEQIMAIGEYDADQGNNAPFFMSVNASNLLRMYGNYGTGFVDITDVSPTTAFTTGTWNHVVGKLNVSSTGRSQIWHNGVRVYDAAASDSGNDFDYNDLLQYTVSSSSGSAAWDGCLGQVAWWAQDIDLDVNIGRFYRGGWVNMGTQGTSSGLVQPAIFHTGGNSADFDNQGGTITATVSINGTLSACT